MDKKTKKALKKLLDHSWGQTGYRYQELTAEERAILGKKTFKKLKLWVLK